MVCTLIHHAHISTRKWDYGDNYFVYLCRSSFPRETQTNIFLILTRHHSQAKVWSQLNPVCVTYGGFCILRKPTLDDTGSWVTQSSSAIESINSAWMLTSNRMESSVQFTLYRSCETMRQCSIRAEFYTISWGTGGSGWDIGWGYNDSLCTPLVLVRVL